MIIFVDGFQNTGKTTLIAGSNRIYDRFPFNQYLTGYELEGKKEELNGFQLGKDLGILFALKYTNYDLVFDRGPFSTIFYSLKENRYGDQTIDVLARFIMDIKDYKNYKYIFVVKKNNKLTERKHNDGFDYLNDDLDENKEKILKDIMNTCKLFKIDIRIFENDFSKSVEDNQKEFNKLLEEMIDEHD